MDCNKSTSIAAVLATSIIMATTFSDQDRLKISCSCDGNGEVRGKTFRETHNPPSHCSLMQQKEYSMLCVHAYQYAVIVKHFFLHTKISIVRYCGRKRHAKHGVKKELKEFNFLKKKRVSLIMLIIALQFDVSTSKKRKETSSFNHADHSFDELKLIINFRLLQLHSGHVVVCTAILPFHDDGSFRFTVIAQWPCCCFFACDDFRCGLAVTSHFLWLAPYTKEIVDVDTSKETFLPHSKYFHPNYEPCN